MKNLKDIEKAGRQAWLATLGTYAKGWEIISDKVPLTFDDANKFVNDLIDNGEKIETELKEKVKSNYVLDEKIAALKVLRKVSNQIIQSRSKWFVGSSNNKISESTIIDLTKPTLLFCPPESLLIRSFLFKDRF